MDLFMLPTCCGETAVVDFDLYQTINGSALSYLWLYFTCVSDVVLDSGSCRLPPSSSIFLTYYSILKSRDYGDVGAEAQQGQKVKSASKYDEHMMNMMGLAAVH